MRSTPLRSQSFPKAQRLRKRADYLRVQGTGRKVHSDHFLLLLTPRRADEVPAARIGVTVSSRVGNAVVRNRMKRWIREYVRRRGELVPPGDLVLVAKTSAAVADHDAIDADLGKLFGRAGGGRA